MIRWIHIADLQLGRGRAEGNDNDVHARTLVERVAREDPDFVIDAGDLVHGGFGGQQSETVHQYWLNYHRTIRSLKRKCPVISAPGNHDATSDGISMERYCRETGRMGQPPYYAATIDGVHVVCLDVVSSAHRGGFPKGSEQEKWLRHHLNRLPAAECLIVVGHYPIFMSPELYGTSDSSLCYNESTGEEGVLLPLLIEARVDLYLCGHLHIYERTRYGCLTQVMAGGDGMAYPNLWQYEPNKYSQAMDERQCYVRYALVEDSIRGEAVSLDGEVLDTWSQRLNRRQ